MNELIRKLTKLKVESQLRNLILPWDRYSFTTFRVQRMGLEQINYISQIKTMMYWTLQQQQQQQQQQQSRSFFKNYVLLGLAYDFHNSMTLYIFKVTKELYQNFLWDFICFTWSFSFYLGKDNKYYKKLL